MRATGIVRRIDDLGRVVIPKEIRRTLRIREGDPLEIFVDRDGEVILKKYSPIGEMGEFAQEYVDALYESLKHITLVSDRDGVIAVAGAPRKDYIDKAVGELVETCMTKRKNSLETTAGYAEVFKGSPEEYSSFVVVPIISGGDPTGSVIMLSKDEDRLMGDTELKLASTAALFLGKQMEH